MNGLAATAKIGLYVSVLLALAVQALGQSAPSFQSAMPVWPAGREKEMNLFVGFRSEFAAVPGSPTKLRATGSTLYRIWLNGKFLGHGPARGPHGFYRVDEIDLTDRVVPGTNLIAFEVAGYNVNSYYLLDQPAFLQAEVTSGDQVLASTGGKGAPFEAGVLKERVQRVQRFSFQRPFSEVYRMAPGFDAWRKDPAASLERVNCAVVGNKSLLPRRVAYPDYAVRGAVRLVSSGQLKTGIPVGNPWKDRSLTTIGPALGGYPENQLETIPSLEIQTFSNATCQVSNRELSPLETLKIPDGGFQIVEFDSDLTGFIGARVVCRQPTRLFFTWDELLQNGDVDFKRLQCVNAIVFELQPGTYELESFEPYTLKYLKVFALGGDCEVGGIHLREYADPNCWRAAFACSDERLNRIFAAGRETFRQNAVDIFMDCPSRERAGWLCDSFYTARVAADLCGDTRIERNFLENFLLPARFEFLPNGCLPMCYPSDHNDGIFIPNWTMWFVLQLEEYLARSGDRELVNALRPRVLKLIDFLKGYKNEDGLLEKLPSWVFIEWSKANEYTQDVNYPSNMLFARVLEACGRMYGLPELSNEAEQMRATIRKQSYDGSYFIDNAKRIDGKLRVTTNRSETCQYYAFYFGTATPGSHPQLWQNLVKDFGTRRKETHVHPEIDAPNMLPGLTLRLELLARRGYNKEFTDEAIRLLLPMAEQTGTLWENDTPSASCNHAFASHITHLLYCSALGVRQLDTVGKSVGLDFTPGPLSWCEGIIPVPQGRIAVRWRKANGHLEYQLNVPAGYSTKVNNQTGLVAERKF